jgi:hypothetical protein
VWHVASVALSHPLEKNLSPPSNLCSYTLPNFT